MDNKLHNSSCRMPMYYISVPPTIVVRKKRFIAQNQIVKITTIRGGLIAFSDFGPKQWDAGLKLGLSSTMSLTLQKLQYH